MDFDSRFLYEKVSLYFPAPECTVGLKNEQVVEQFCLFLDAFCNSLQFLPWSLNVLMSNIRAFGGKQTSPPPLIHLGQGLGKKTLTHVYGTMCARVALKGREKGAAAGFLVDRWGERNGGIH